MPDDELGTQGSYRQTMKLYLVNERAVRLRRTEGLAVQLDKRDIYTGPVRLREISYEGHLAEGFCSKRDKKNCEHVVIRSTLPLQPE